MQSTKCWFCFQGGFLNFIELFRASMHFHLIKQSEFFSSVLSFYQMVTSCWHGTSSDGLLTVLIRRDTLSFQLIRPTKFNMNNLQYQASSRKYKTKVLTNYNTSCQLVFVQFVLCPGDLVITSLWFETGMEVVRKSETHIRIWP